MSANTRDNPVERRSPKREPSAPPRAAVRIALRQCAACRALLALSGDECDAATHTLSDSTLRESHCAFRRALPGAVRRDAGARQLEAGARWRTALQCAECHVALGWTYDTSDSVRFDWQRGAAIFARAKLVEYVVGERHAAFQARQAELLEAVTVRERESDDVPVDDEARLTRVLRDDARLQHVYAALDARVRAAVRDAKRLEQHLVAAKVVPKESAEQARFECTVAGCGATFTREHRLRRHEHVAHDRGEIFSVSRHCWSFQCAPFSHCPAGRQCVAMYCNEFFKTRADLDEHVASAHPAVARRRLKKQKVKNEPDE